MSKQPLKGVRIAIVGGGPGGLLLARLLQLNSAATVTVYERRRRHKVVQPNHCRGRLTLLLSNSVKPGTVEWNKHFLNLSQESDSSYKISFEDGTFTMADVLVGSDGGRSKVSPFVTSIKPYYMGFHILEAVMKKAKEIINWFEADFPDYSDFWLELWEKADLPVVLRPQYITPTDKPWDHPPILTLIGDAAHVVPPYGATGVNGALHDAYMLAKFLVDQDHYKTPQGAIEGYEEYMRKQMATNVKTVY
uniref:FAD-binding domain-containing protein n=1 Tax=Ditylenchus dipsaci TaxID=166011 RepID=A0A915D0E5_9BILA